MKVSERACNGHVTVGATTHRGERRTRGAARGRRTSAGTVLKVTYPLTHMPATCPLRARYVTVTRTSAGTSSTSLIVSSSSSVSSWYRTRTCPGGGAAALRFLPCDSGSGSMTAWREMAGARW